MKHCVN